MPDFERGNEGGYCNIILQLLEAGATPRLIHGRSQTRSKNAIAALMCARHRGDFSEVEAWHIMQAFVKKRVSLNVVDVSDLRLLVDEDGWGIGDCFHPPTLAQAVVSHASRAGNLNIIQMLLERGADPNVRDNHGRTALRQALRLELFEKKDRTEIVRLLLQHGADPNLPYLLGQKQVLPLQTAVYCEWDDGKEDGWLSDSDSSGNAGIVDAQRQEIIDLLVEAGGVMLARDAINKPHHHLRLALTATRQYAYTNFKNQWNDFQLVSKLYER
jgi:ankyrin repeat protein